MGFVDNKNRIYVAFKIILCWSLISYSLDVDLLFLTDVLKVHFLFLLLLAAEE